MGATLFVAGFVASSYHWIVTPLQARLGIDELAARLEHHFGSLRDQLSSAVNFLEGGDSSSALMREAVARTEEEVSGIPLESALSMGPLAANGLFLWGALTLLTILWLAPQWIRVGAARYLGSVGRQRMAPCRRHHAADRRPGRAARRIDNGSAAHRPRMARGHSRGGSSARRGRRIHGVGDATR